MKVALFECKYWGSGFSKKNNLANFFDANTDCAAALLRKFGVPMCSVEDKTNKQRLWIPGLACRSCAESHYCRNPRVGLHSTSLRSDANNGMTLIFQHICAWGTFHIAGVDLA